MKTYEAFYNENSGSYEIHKPGCAHSKKPFMHGGGWMVEASNPQEACVNYEKDNEGCWGTPAPCAKRV